MDGFAYDNDRYCCEQVPLEEIASRYGTPAYVYSRAAITGRWNDLDGAFGARHHRINYAVKANSNLSILALLVRLGTGFDIVSVGELERVLAAGGDPARVVFSGVGKSAAELERALAAGVDCINIESVSEFDRLESIARANGATCRVAVRVNPDVDARTHPYISTGLKTNKFGVETAGALELYRRIARSAQLEASGIACHIGSQLTSTEPFADACRRLVELYGLLADEGIRLDHLDLGGGLGIRYRDEDPPDVQTYVDVLLANTAGIDEGVRLDVEPGRWMTGNSGVLLTRVEYIKRGTQKNFVVVDAGMNDLIRPSLYQAWQDIIPVLRRAGGEPFTCDVVGPVCESADFLGRDRVLNVREGDILAVLSSGAYCSVMGSNYNSRPRSAEVLVSGPHARVVRRRESIEDLLAPEREYLLQSYTG